MSEEKEKRFSEWAKNLTNLPLLTFEQIKHKIPLEYLPTVQNDFSKEEFLVLGYQYSTFTNIIRKGLLLIGSVLLLCAITTIITTTISVIFTQEYIDFIFTSYLCFLAGFFVIVYFWFSSKRKASFILYSRNELINLSFENKEVKVTRTLYSTIPDSSFLISLPSTKNESLTQLFENYAMISNKYSFPLKHSISMPNFYITTSGGLNSQFLSDNVEEDLSRLLSFAKKENFSVKYSSPRGAKWALIIAGILVSFFFFALAIFLSDGLWTNGFDVTLLNVSIMMLFFGVLVILIHCAIASLFHTGYTITINKFFVDLEESLRTYTPA